MLTVDGDRERPRTRVNRTVMSNSSMRAPCAKGIFAHPAQQFHPAHRLSARTSSQAIRSSKDCHRPVARFRPCCWLAESSSLIEPRVIKRGTLARSALLDESSGTIDDRVVAEVVIEYLEHRPDVIPILARWVWREWGFASIDGCTSDLASSQRGTIPSRFAALRRGRPTGIVNLIECNLPPRCQLTPWLAGLFVHADYRGTGIGSDLVRFCEREAKRLGFESLYLYTERAEDFYKRLGWRKVESLMWDGAPVTVMSRQLSAWNGDCSQSRNSGGARRRGSIATKSLAARPAPSGTTRSSWGRGDLGAHRWCH